MVSPGEIDRTIATFTGGFKREHGAFRYGPLAQRNHGSHYGFIEEGVLFSKLQPGLATVLVMNDGAVNLKTWMPSDGTQLARVRYARQSGVPSSSSTPRTGRACRGSSSISGDPATGRDPPMRICERCARGFACKKTVRTPF